MVNGKCIVCDVKPASSGGYVCHNCQAKIDAERRQRQKAKPEKYLVYRGDVVGLVRNGNGNLTPRLLGCDPKRLPKAKTLNLDTYLDGYTRAQVKKFKAAVKQAVAV